MKEDFIISFKIIGWVCIVAFFLVGCLLIHEIIYNNKAAHYCKEQGWDGFEKGVCYKIIPHESGIGTTKIVTGKVDVYNLREGK